eukprot:SAG31_NODE_3880_length_3789_cov_8.522764_2_plen_23_part_01
MNGRAIARALAPLDQNGAAGAAG